MHGRDEDARALKLNGRNARWDTQSSTAELPNRAVPLRALDLRALPERRRVAQIWSPPRRVDFAMPSEVARRLSCPSWPGTGAAPLASRIANVTERFGGRHSEASNDVKAATSTARHAARGEHRKGRESAPLSQIGGQATRRPGHQALPTMRTAPRPAPRRFDGGPNANPSRSVLISGADASIFSFEKRELTRLN